MVCSLILCFKRRITPEEINNNGEKSEVMKGGLLSKCVCYFYFISNVANPLGKNSKHKERGPQRHSNN